jgi:uncharacterized protein (DUF2237 family)
MAYYIGSTNYYPGIFPAPSAASNGSPLVANSTTQAFWAYPGSSQSTPSGALQTRSIFTHGYVAGGYKDSNPWRTVNKTWHANDITISCGEQLDQGAAYAGSTFSDYNGYCHGTNPGFAVASTHTSSYSLATGVGRTQNTSSWGANPGGPFGYTGKDPVNDGAGVAYGTSGSNTGIAQSTTAGEGSWELSVARTYFGGTQNQTGQVGYITGGAQSGACDKFNFPTEIMYITTAPGVNANHVTGSGGASTAWWSIAGTNKSLAFSNDTWAAWAPGTQAAPDGVCKMLGTKLGWHYVGTGSNVTTPMMKWNDSTGTTMSTTISKPSAQGEENMEMGQNWGYCLGAYNGLQNNYTFKVTYSSDTIVVMGTATQPKGHVGMSSAGTSSAAASITMGNN